MKEERETLDKFSPSPPAIDLHLQFIYLPFFLSLSEHKVVFLNGSCSGMVGIERGRKTYWVSGSKNTWNQESANTVCRQMHCGEASAFNATPSGDMMKDVSKHAYSCSSNTTSLFKCGKTTPPSDHKDTIATVTCSGNVKECVEN